MKLFLGIILNIIGIAICFIVKYNNRREKDKGFSLSFWMRDNWPELMVTGLLDVAIVLLVVTGDLQINAAKFLPEWVIASGSLTLYFLIGLAISAGVYEIIKTKSKKNEVAA